MKSFYISILFLFLILSTSAQNQFHVFPINHLKNPGSKFGTGSIDLPWDLQTALSNTQNIIKAGDVIYLHDGIYNGRYVSNLNSSGKKITVSAYKNDKVILDGNITSKQTAVLEVNGANVIFKNFEITFLGNFSRNIKDKNFKSITGINHLNGEDCAFINLKIHNIPGTAIGSWKRTGGTKIEQCIIFNNGYIGKQRGHGVGIYVQNKSEQIRLIHSNTIFNNYYKGIQVWDASSRSAFEYVKNVTLSNNVIFNNGLPSGKHWANIIIASDDNFGLNVAKNIKINDNILYHNSDFLNDNKNFGDGVSLALGYNKNAPIDNVSLNNNIIIGKNNALNILHVKHLIFKNNTVYTGYIHFKESILESLESKLWKFESNMYYSRRLNAFRVLKHKDFTIDQWQNQFKLDSGSQRKHISQFDLKTKLNITRLNGENNFRVTLFHKQGNDVEIDFLNYQIKKGSTYTIRNIENDTVIKTGIVSGSLKIQFPMGNYNQTEDNFGVYSIEFVKEAKEKRKSFFKRIFGWLF